MSQSTYDKMSDYIEALFIVFRKFNEKTKDTRQKMIALTIYNYVRYMSKQYNVDLSTIIEPEMINLIPIFEYISHENIEFYDFSKINMNDVLWLPYKIFNLVIFKIRTRKREKYKTMFLKKNINEKN